MPHNQKKAPISFAWLLFALPLLLVLAYCANPVPPMGGPEDRQPPRVVEEKSTPNFSTNFTGKEIRITFDEWVQVTDVFNQVVVSPPQDEAPEIKLKGKTLILTFKDSLRENTTYTIYFGEAVKDITRNNAAKDLRYVLSTGPYIDSLSTRGRVADAATGDQLEGVLVMLYRNSSDSIVFQSKPDYFAKTNEAGAFSIENIGGGDYKVFALKDNNFNYRYDLDNELIGFLADLVTITDSTNSQINILLFQENPSLKLLNTNQNSYGKVRFEFNSTANKVMIRTKEEVDNLTSLQEASEKFLTYWYDAPNTDSLTLLVTKDKQVIDTTGLKIPDRNVFVKGKIRIKVDETTAEDSKLSTSKKGAKSNPASEKTSFDIHPDQAFYLNFNLPIQDIQAAEISLVDSLGTASQPKISKVDGHPRRLKIEHDWLPQTYKLLIPEGALNSIFPVINEEISLDLNIQNKEQFGNILTKIYGLKANQNYIVDLMKGSETAAESYFVTGLDSTSHDYMGLLPGSYKLRITEDKNGNNQWDPGNYMQKTMPERIIIKSLPNLKANWDVEGIVNISDNPQKPTTGKKSLNKQQ